MRKLIILLFTSISILSLSSCHIKIGGEVSDNYFNRSLHVTEIVYQSLRNQDAKSIKDLMCDRLKNLPDVDQQIQSLFDSVDGTILPINLDEVMSVNTSSSARDEKEYTEVSTIGKIPNLKTDTNKNYEKLLVFYCYVDKEQPDLEGIYAISLVEKDGSIFYDVCMPDEILNQTSLETSS